MDSHECRLCFKRGDNHIELFDGSEHSVFVVSIINEHISETRHDDLLPNYICHECWRETDAFHTFHRSVQSAQSNYLLQFVKNEFNETAVSIEEVNVDEMNVEEDMHALGSIEVAEVEHEITKQEPEQSEDMFDDAVPDSIEEDDDNETTESQSKDANFDFTCDVCGTEQGSFNGLISHNKKQHEKIGYIKCCSNKYFSEATFNEHIEHHKNPDMYKCKDCGVQLRNKKSYYYHTYRHKKKFICDICNHTTADKYYMAIHMQDYHMGKMLKKSKKCTACLKRFSSLGKLEAHNEQCFGEDAINAVKEQQSALKNLISSINAGKIVIGEYFDMSCDLCSDGVKYDSLAQIQYHYLNEHQVNHGYIKCSCNKQFKTQKKILDHAPYHIDKEICKCKVCGKQKCTVAEIYRHLRIHERLDKYECNQCGKRFKKQSSLLLHIHNIHRKGQKQEKVPMPTITDENRPDLSEYFDMKCTHGECKSTFTSFQQAKLHYLQEHNDSNGFIRCCGINFNTIEKVDEHLLSHIHPEQFTCSYCGKICATKYSYSSHISKHKSREAGAHKCKICQKVFIDSHQLRQHLKVHEEKIDQQPKIQCSFCKRKFATEDTKASHEKRMHLKTANKDEIQKHQCEFCGKGYEYRSQLRAHINVVHASNNKMHQCDICSAMLKSKAALRQHRNRHTALPKKCPHCEKVSPNSMALEMHIDHMHKLKSIHKCHLCEKSFKVISSLKSHIATHTGAKNFKCSYCPESFSWRPNMYTHQKKAHPEEYAENKKRKMLNL